MGTGHLWLLARPEHRRMVRAAEQARAAAYGTVFAAIGRGLWRGVAAGLEKLRRFRMRRATIRELSALDDATLKDLGVQRGEIWHIADDLAAAATGEPPVPTDQPTASEPGVAAADPAATELRRDRAA